MADDGDGWAEFSKKRSEEKDVEDSSQAATPSAIKKVFRSSPPRATPQRGRPPIARETRNTRTVRGARTPHLATPGTAVLYDY